MHSFIHTYIYMCVRAHAHTHTNTFASQFESSLCVSEGSNAQLLYPSGNQNSLTALSLIPIAYLLLPGSLHGQREVREDKALAG